MIDSAVITNCGEYRYALTRSAIGCIVTSPPAVFIMLNPSTADATIDDPTIRRCRGFAKLWGCNGIVVVNLYALRSTKPEALWNHPNPIGPENDEWIRRYAFESSVVVCAWGVNAKIDRAESVAKMLIDAGIQLMCLGKTTTGAPRHPLYVKGDQPLIPFVQREVSR